MYNLEVEEAHTFFVSPQGWLVHNGGNKKPPLTATERSVLVEATRFFKPEVMSKIEAAYKSGQTTYIKVDNRTILIEPNNPYSGFTDFEGKTLSMGADTIQSPEELRKTIPHELYRLKTSNVAKGLSGAMAASETESTFGFAEKAYDYLFGGCP